MRTGEWWYWGGDAGSTKYSSLEQIDRDNVARVEVVWVWTGPDVEREASDRSLGPTRFEATPLMIGDTIYVSTAHGDVVAIDPATGENRWHFDTESWKDGRPSNVGWVHRGVAHWRGEVQSGGRTGRTVESSRIFIATGNARLWAIEASTGEPIAEFGEQGRIDLKKQLRRPAEHRTHGVSSPPIVCGDVIVVGSTILDRPLTQTFARGDVHAFDVRSGNARWVFHDPPLAGEPGYESWRDDSAERAGNANVWTTMSCDRELGMVYLPFSTPTNDFYGGHRQGDGLFGESLVALDAATGERRWHFQTVHHGVWDYDLPTAPILVDVEVDGRPIRAVAQITKQGYVFVFDRVTGEPMWPIEEHAVPPSIVEGEELSRTQPVPTKPAPFERQGIRPDDLIDWTPELRAEAYAILSQYHYGPLYTPPRTDLPTINLPGNAGGGNWPGGAFDPETGILYVPSHYGPTAVRLVRPDPSRSHMRFVPDVEIAIPGPQGLHLLNPPYGRITAIDLSTGNTLWWTPHGSGPLNHPLLAGLDLGPMGNAHRGYPLVTKTLLFAAQGNTARNQLPSESPDEPNLRAFDKATGELLWEMKLPVEGQPFGNPMTYEHRGKQYLVVAVSPPSQLVALALP